MPAWVIAVEWSARGILLLLLGLSVWSVAIMLDRRRVLNALLSQGNFLDEAKKQIATKNWTGLKSLLTNNNTPTLYINILRAAMSSGSNQGETIDRAVKSVLTEEKLTLEKGLTALATLGSNAPFIGLFGTVLGIIQAFAVLGAGSSNTTSVMTGISEALISTAVGLFVAIPAVVAYNAFSRNLKVILVKSESIVNFYISKMDPSSKE